MHAALVLLDGPVALGAGLGVGQDPVQVLTLSTVLRDPLAHSVAAHLGLSSECTITHMRTKTRERPEGDGQLHVLQRGRPTATLVWLYSCYSCLQSGKLPSLLLLSAALLVMQSTLPY